MKWAIWQGTSWSSSTHDPVRVRGGDPLNEGCQFGGKVLEKNIMKEQSTLVKTDDERNPGSQEGREEGL